MFGQTTKQASYDKDGKATGTANVIDFSVFAATFLNAQLYADNSKTSIAVGLGFAFADNQLMLIPTYDFGNVLNGNRFSLLLSTSVFSPR